jgi:hypothetical protein
MGATIRRLVAEGRQVVLEVKINDRAIKFWLASVFVSPAAKLLLNPSDAFVMERPVKVINVPSKCR